MVIKYNAPVVLTFAIVSALVLLINQHFLRGLIPAWFSVSANFNPASFRCWVTLVSHIIGNAGWNQYLSNFAFILLLGPILEESYSSWSLVVMLAITALVTAVLNILVFKTTLLGAGGVVFMMILLASFTNFSKGELPLSFILVLIIYLGREFLNAFDTGDIDNFAHIVGGFCGSLFGFFRPGKSAVRKRT
jgi:membrane associated rhomboid family serine protease